MLCPDPNCNGAKLHTVETFQTNDSTVRTKVCPVCKWRFTTEELFTAEQTIPVAIRNSKRVSNGRTYHSGKRQAVAKFLRGVGIRLSSGVDGSRLPMENPSYHSRGPEGSIPPSEGGDRVRHEGGLQQLVHGQEDGKVTIWPNRSVPRT